MLIRLLLTLLVGVALAGISAARDSWSGIERIVAVGDVHGDFKQFVTLLQTARLVNEEQQWIGGKTHLVQTGDVLDRGPDSRQVMDLLMQLEKQARKAGGYVHCLIGNHEAMNVYGDLRYTTPEEYAAFRDSNSERLRESIYNKHIEQLKKNPPSEGLPPLDAAYRDEWESRHPLGWYEHRFAFGPRGKYGRWIREHNTIVKINDTLFVHGGISPRFARERIKVLNQVVAKELGDLDDFRGGLVTDPQGPLWYRGLAQEQASETEVELILQNYGCRRIVIAHTVTEGAILPKYGGRVILIDVGLAQFYGGALACLVIEKGSVYALHRGHQMRLPSRAGPELLDYLKRAARLEPQPSRLESLIRKTEAKTVTPSTEAVGP